MCQTCAGTIIIETADGLQTKEHVQDCDIRSYRRAFMPKLTYASFVNNTELPMESIAMQYREYVYKGKRVNGLKVYEEDIKIEKKTRKIEEIEALQLEDSI